MYQYGHVLHVVGTYDNLEKYAREAQAALDASYALAVAQARVPSDAPRAVVYGPSNPLPGSRTYQQRHYAAWVVNSPTYRLGSPFLMPQGLGYVLMKDEQAFNETIQLRDEGYGSGLYGVGPYGGGYELGFGVAPYGQFQYGTT